MFYVLFAGDLPARVVWLREGRRQPQVHAPAQRRPLSTNGSATVGAQDGRDVY